MELTRFKSVVLTTRLRMREVLQNEKLSHYEQELQASGELAGSLLSPLSYRYFLSARAKALKALLLPEKHRIQEV